MPYTLEDDLCPRSSLAELVGDVLDINLEIVLRILGQRSTLRDGAPQLVEHLSNLGSVSGDS